MQNELKIYTYIHDYIYTTLSRTYTRDYKHTHVCVRILYGCFLIKKQDATTSSGTSHTPISDESQEAKKYFNSYTQCY